MKHIKLFEEINDTKYPYTLFNLSNALFNFIYKFIDLLPQQENNYYTIKLTGNAIRITNVSDKTKKNTVGFFVLDKNDDYTQKSKFGKNINKKIFTIKLFSEPTNNQNIKNLINTIITYIVNKIDNNNKIEIYEDDDNYRPMTKIIFMEEEFDNIINTINDMSIYDYEINSSANKFNL